eukprot:scaffold71942_cov69-Phaeocystis_antarctica.AAC.1
MGSICGKAHALPHNTQSNGQHNSGAMEELSEKVQNANTHILRRHIHEHAHSSRSVQGPVQGGDGTSRMGSIRRKAHPLPQNTHSKGQFSSGAMESYTWVRFAGKLTCCQTTHITTVSISARVKERFTVQAWALLRSMHRLR